MSSETLVSRSTQNTAVVIAHTCDDPARVLTAVQYAARGNGKVVLAQTDSAPRRATSNGGLRRRKPSSLGALNSPTTKPSQWAGTWSEILSRVFLLGKMPLDEIPQIVRALGAHQLVLSSAQLAEEFWETTNSCETEETLAAPVWVLGRNVAATVPERIKRILLPVSLGSGFEGPLRTASQIACSWGATVAILHVVTHEEKALKEPCTPLTVSTRLQRFLQQLCDAHCPLEISIRDGDPSEAILKFDALHPHDLILLRCAEDFGVQRPICGTTRRVLNEAHCPVLLTRPEPERLQTPADLLISETPVLESMLIRSSGVVQ